MVGRQTFKRYNIRLLSEFRRRPLASGSESLWCAGADVTFLISCEVWNCISFWQHPSRIRGCCSQAAAYFLHHSGNPRAENSSNMAPCQLPRLLPFQSQARIIQKRLTVDQFHCSQRLCPERLILQRIKPVLDENDYKGRWQSLWSSVVWLFEQKSFNGSLKVASECKVSVLK